METSCFFFFFFSFFFLRKRFSNVFIYVSTATQRSVDVTEDVRHGNSLIELNEYEKRN